MMLLDRYLCVALWTSDGILEREEIEALYGVHHVYSQKKSKVSFATGWLDRRNLMYYRMKKNSKRRQTLSSMEYLQSMI